MKRFMLCLFVLVIGGFCAAAASFYATTALAEGGNCDKAAPQKISEPKAMDYPTTAVADYVFGCMAANGESREALFHCSCSFDIMASILPYSKYEQAETILSVGQQGGDSTAMMRTNPQLKEIVAEVRRAQAEADVRCF
jgi:hypothetical protein